MQFSAMPIPAGFGWALLVRTGRTANPIRSAGVSGSDANHLTSNGVNINSSLLGQGQVLKG